MPRPWLCVAQRKYSVYISFPQKSLNQFLSRNEDKPLIFTVTSVMGDHRITLSFLSSSSPSGAFIISHVPGNPFPISLCIGGHGCACCTLKVSGRQVLLASRYQERMLLDHSPRQMDAVKEKDRNPRLSDSIPVVASHAP